MRRTLKSTGVIVAVIIIVIAGFAVVAASILLVQSVSATTDVITGTTVGGEEEGATTSGNATTSTDSNVTLGNLFYSARTVEETFNPINETYFVISYVDSVTLMPPNATGVVINATDRGNLTTNILPNGLSISQGQGFLVTEEDGSQEESATSTFVSLGRSNPEGTTGSATGAIFFSTNSTGQLAFLNNIVGIAQLEFSPEGSTLKIWEWKGGTLAPILE
jgi:hypothetical protein